MTDDQTEIPTEPLEAPASRILVVDDDEIVLESLGLWLQADGFVATTCETPEKALEALSGQQHMMMITDLMLPEMDGLELMDRAKAIDPELQVVILTSYGSIESAIKAIRGGAYDYIQKPVHPETIRHVIRRIREQQDLVRQVRFLRTALRHRFHTGEAIGKSHQIRHLFELAALVADSRASVLIQGETGTGKEVLARLIHAMGRENKGPFLLCDCKSVSDELLRQDLFGFHPSNPESSLLAGSDKGTLMLQEIGELSPDLQIRLLNFLQDQMVRDEEGKEVLKPDVRVVATSSKDLVREISAGRFREDLYYRLAVAIMEVPPLRERKIDLLPLAEHFLARACAEHGVMIRGFHRHALALMMEYHWPGNITELEETIEQAVLVCNDQLLMFHHLPSTIRELFTGTSLDFRRSLKEVEREHVLKVLEGVEWNRTRAAEVLGIQRMTLYNKIRDYKLAPSAPVFPPNP